MDNFEQAIKAAKDLSSHEGEDHRVINHHSNYLNGSLYVVGFKDKEGGQLVNYVYIEGDEVNVCKNPSLLNEFVARKSRKTGLESVINSLGNIPGIIGLIITIAIVWILIKDPKSEIPQVLSTALTVILGFYFGTKATK